MCIVVKLPLAVSVALSMSLPMIVYDIGTVSQSKAMKLHFIHH